MGIRCADHVTPLYPQKLALTSPTGGGRSVGTVRSRTKATESYIIIINTLLPDNLWTQSVFSCSARTQIYPKYPDRICGQFSLQFYGYRRTCPATKRPGRVSDHSFSSSVEVENEWNCTSIYPTCLRGMNRETFTHVLWDIPSCLQQNLNDVHGCW